MNSHARRLHRLAPIRRVVAVLVTASLVVLAGGLVTGAQAAFATGGIGRFGGSLEWISWGTDHQGIPNVGDSTTNTFVVGGQTVDITCTLSNITDVTGGRTGSLLSAYRSGDYSGDGLDDLYNIGGTGTSNRLIAGLATQSGDTVRFNFTCSGALNGTAFPLSGLVMADAESTNGNGEFISATIPSSATWRMIDRYRNNSDPNCARNSVLAARTPSNALTVSSTGECSTGSPMAVAYMDGTSAATAVTVKGGGVEAIALGVFVGFDHGDAPASYGDAANLVDTPLDGGTIPDTGAKVRVSDPAFSLASVGQPDTRLGATVDTEDGAEYSADANGDDDNAVLGQGNDEDGISPPAPISVLPGDTYTLPDVSCTGPGRVAGWIDWNDDGTFDPGERSALATCTGTTTVPLTWTVPSDAVTSTGSEHTFLRLRIGASSAADASPVGAQIGGETEDYPLDVTITQPAATDDTATTPFDTPVTIDPLANDTPADGTHFDPTTVRLLDPDTGLPGTTITTAAGTFQVDTTTGHVTFDPAVGFRGPTPPIGYQVTDNLGRATQADISITVGDPAKPTPQPDTPTTRQGEPVTFTPTSNDTPGPTGAAIVAASLRLLDADGNPVTSVTVHGEGRYTVNTSTGKVTFTPEPGFTGVASPVQYRVTDTNGAVGVSSITPTVTPVTPVATPDEATTGANVPVTIDVLANDHAGASAIPLDPSTVRLVDPSTGDPVTTLDVAGQGTFRVNPTTGSVTFTPVTGFTGPVTPPTYTVADQNGTSSTSSITVTVSDGPAARPDSATTGQQEPVTLSPVVNDLRGADGVELDPASLRLIDPATGNAVTTLTVADVGTYTVGDDGTVRFVPEPGFTGQSAPVTYQIADVNGAPASSTLQVTVVAAPPKAEPDVASTTQATPVTIDPLADDREGSTGAALVADSVRLLDPVTDLPVTTLTIDGQGTYTVDTATGMVTFTPLAGFSGTGLPVRYSVADANGATSVSTITPDVTPQAPLANPDVAHTLAGVAVTTSLLADDAPGAGRPLVPDTLRLVGPGGALVTTLTNKAGTYAVDSDGTVTFRPAHGFTGTAPSVGYSVADTAGVRAASTYTVIVDAPPIAADDTATTAAGHAVTVAVLANDKPGSSPLDPSSVRLIDPASGASATHVTVSGVGTWVAHTNGTVTFTPAAGFTGQAVIDYRVSDLLGHTATARITVSVTAAPGSSASPTSPTTTTSPLPTMTSPSQLAATGFDPWPLTGLAAVVVLGGLLLLAVGRRRPRHG